MMKLQIIETADGSHSLFVEELDETYHSRHGAVREAMHVFIEAGLREIVKNRKEITVFEVGFGTGLNAFLSLHFAEKYILKVDYYTVEKYPVSAAVLKKLNYVALTGTKKEDLYEKLHQVEWESMQEITSLFSVQKIQSDLNEYSGIHDVDLIYYDAFGPRAQPEMWRAEHFQKMYHMLRPGGILVTYCCKGQVRRDMAAAGFKVEKLPGPPGKREMVRARK